MRKKERKKKTECANRSEKGQVKKHGKGRGERRERNKGGGRTVKATNDSEDRQSVEAKREATKERA